MRVIEIIKDRYCKIADRVRANAAVLVVASAARTVSWALEAPKSISCPLLERLIFLHQIDQMICYETTWCLLQEKKSHILQVLLQQKIKMINFTIYYRLSSSDMTAVPETTTCSMLFPLCLANRRDVFCGHSSAVISLFLLLTAKFCPLFQRFISLGTCFPQWIDVMSVCLVRSLLRSHSRSLTSSSSAHFFSPRFSSTMKTVRIQIFTRTIFLTFTLSLS